MVHQQHSHGESRYAVAVAETEEIDEILPPHRRDEERNRQKYQKFCHNFMLFVFAKLRFFFELGTIFSPTQLRFMRVCKSICFFPFRLRRKKSFNLVNLIASLIFVGSPSARNPSNLFKSFKSFLFVLFGKICKISAACGKEYLFARRARRISTFNYQFSIYKHHGL